MFVGFALLKSGKLFFSWLVNSDANIIFLQETYSTRDIENIWRKRWKGEMFFSHGSKHSRGVLSPLPNTPAILINDILIPILDASSKHIYRSFLAKKQTTPTAKEKLSAKYHHLTIDWKRVYLILSFRTTLETKLREFQFKILNRVVFTNEKLFRFGMAVSDTCVFCQTEV